MAFIGQTSRFNNRDATRIVDAPCDPSVQVGKWVRVNAANIVVHALADSLENSNVIGLVEEKSEPGLCTIRFLGDSDELFTGLDVTKEYYLSNVQAGEMSTAIPQISGHIIIKIGQPTSDTSFLVLKGTRIQRA